jgi:predicted amidophosphoribosyltransferase
MTKDTDPMTPEKLQAKIDQEKATVSKMICIYCKGNHHPESVPCPECQELIDYCDVRIDHCPHMETKTFCSACPTHCYKPEMRERIKTAMAYAGPRMLLVDPVLGIEHLIQGRPHSKG